MTTINTTFSMTVNTYRVDVIERILAEYRVEAESPRAAAEGWADGDLIHRDDEALDTEGPTAVWERRPDGTWRRVPPSEWREAGPAIGTDTAPPRVADPAKRPFSVVLMWPRYLTDGYDASFYAWVEARDSVEAVALAKGKALAANKWGEADPADFTPLLVIEGHHHEQPMTND